MVRDDDELRQGIIDAAAELFAERGYGGTRVRMIAERAVTTSRTVRRLTGGRAELFAEVMADKATSVTADRLAAAAADPDAPPLLSVLLDAVQEIFAAPERSWNQLELEALVRAQGDEQIRELETKRLRRRWDTVEVLSRRTQSVGGLSETVDRDAFTYFALALSVGMAAIEPVVPHHPRADRWLALMARLGTSLTAAADPVPPDLETTATRRLRMEWPGRAPGLSWLVRSLDGLGVTLVSAMPLAAEEPGEALELVVAAPEQLSPDTLRSVAAAGGGAAYTTWAAEKAGQDELTHLLDRVTDLVADPTDAPSVVAELVAADHVEVTAAAEGVDDDADVLRLQWTPEHHVVLQRDWAPFARAEKARASAVLRLAAAIAAVRGDDEALGWVEPLRHGGTVWVRLARPEDADAVAAMHERSSERSLYLRYLTGGGEWRDMSLRRLSGGHRGATLVAMAEDGSIVGLGNLFPDPAEGEGAAEIAVLVEDAYQGRGVGTVLLRRLVTLARRLGFREVVATLLAENDDVLRLLERLPLDWQRSTSGAIVTMRAPLAVLERAGR